MYPDQRVSFCAFLCLLSFRLLALVQAAKGDTPTRKEIEQAWQTRYCQLLALPSSERTNDLITTYGSFHREYGFSKTDVLLEAAISEKAKTFIVSPSQFQCSTPPTLSDYTWCVRLMVPSHNVTSCVSDSGRMESEAAHVLGIGDNMDVRSDGYLLRIKNVSRIYLYAIVSVIVRTGSCNDIISAVVSIRGDASNIGRFDTVIPDKTWVVGQTATAECSYLTTKPNYYLSLYRNNESLPFILENPYCTSNCEIDNRTIAETLRTKSTRVYYWWQTSCYSSERTLHVTLKVDNFSDADVGLYRCKVEAEGGIVVNESPVANITLSAHESCSGSWTNPSYRANWTVEGDCVSFYVTATTEGWVGLGFSLNQQMPKSDIVVGAADDRGNSFVVDGYANSRSRPTEDGSNDLQRAHVRRRGRTVTLRFTRKLVTNDSDDVPLDQCVYLLFAWNGRVTNYTTRMYSYHGKHRFSSDRLVCFPNATVCPLECEYNGQSYNPGDTFNATDGCNTCHCTTTGLVVCTLIACRPKMICPTPLGFGVCVEACSSDDDCALDERCCSNGCGHQCTKGTLCAAVLCLKPNCTSNDIIPPGPDECCGTCGCRYGGKLYSPGETFPSTDGCNTCTCSEGHVTCTERACIPTCPIEGQRYFDIRNGECVPCQQTCGQVPRVCILICRSGCGCPVGQLIDPAQNKCVNHSECTPECPVQGQIYYGGNRCAPCDGTCDRPLVPCPRICRRGCACPRGQVIDPAQNRCVALSACPPRCPIQGQRYFNASKGECVPCTGTCEDTSPICTRECRSGCGCPTGTVLDEENNRCIHPRTCPRKCEYEGEVYEPGDRWDCSDSGKCMKCWCLANGVVVNNTLGCPVICTRSLCERNANANCSISCSNTSILTSCRACYYDDDERSVPRKCRYKCGSNPSFNCLKKWGNCVRKTFNKKFGKARKRDRRDGLFKCATPTPCGE